MNSILVSAPTIELVSLESAKDYLRVTHTFEDDLILRFIKSVIRRCETKSRLTFGRQTWDTTFEIPRARRNCLLPGYAALSDVDNVYKSVKLPKRPLKEVVSVSATNTKDASTTVIAPENYTILSGKVFWKSEFWGLVGAYDFITVRYTTGSANFEEFQANYPDLYEAILMALDHSYNNHGEGGMPAEAAQILASYWTSPTFDA